MPEFPTPLALDLFCGLGGWSDGLVKVGFKVVGIEIETKIAAKYNHDCIIADCRKLPIRNIVFDLIVGSPPCRDFTRLPDHAIRKNGKLWKWKVPKNPEKGLELVNSFLRIVDDMKPIYWLMENVSGLIKYLKIKPRCKTYIGKSMQRCFWGSFPGFLVPKSLAKKKIWHIEGPLRSWERARIPEPVAKALGESVKNSMTVTI